MEAMVRHVAWLLHSLFQCLLPTCLGPRKLRTEGGQRLELLSVRLFPAWGSEFSLLGCCGLFLFFLQGLKGLQEVETS